MLRIVLLAIVLWHGYSFTMMQELKPGLIASSTIDAFINAVKINNVKKVTSMLKKTSFLTQSRIDFTTGRTAIHLASSIEMIDALLKAGADVNEKDLDGMTALHLNVWYFDEELALHLLKRGADSTIKNKYGHNAHAYATKEMEKVYWLLAPASSKWSELIEEREILLTSLRNIKGKRQIIKQNVITTQNDTTIEQYILRKNYDRTFKNWLLQIELYQQLVNKIKELYEHKEPSKEQLKIILGKHKNFKTYLEMQEKKIKNKINLVLSTLITNYRKLNKLEKIMNEQSSEEDKN